MAKFMITCMGWDLYAIKRKFCLQYQSTVR